VSTASRDAASLAHDQNCRTRFALLEEPARCQGRKRSSSTLLRSGVIDSPAEDWFHGDTRRSAGNQALEKNQSKMNKPSFSDWPRDIRTLNHHTHRHFLRRKPYIRRSRGLYPSIKTTHTVCPVRPHAPVTNQSLQVIKVCKNKRMLHSSLQAPINRAI
jgi:hypothetical protein